MDFSAIWEGGILAYYGQNMDMGLLLLILGWFILPAALGYFLGGVNFTCFIFKFRFGENIWEYGSGAYIADMKNSHGIVPVFAAVTGDVFKTLLAIFVFGRFVGGETGAAVAAVACLIGDIRSPYLKFKGGNGITCAAVAVLASNPVVFAIVAVIYFILVLVTKYVSLGYFIAFTVYPLILFRTVGPGSAVLGALVLAAVVVFKNRKRIAAIRNGEEKKTYLFKKEKKG